MWKVALSFNAVAAKHEKEEHKAKSSGSAKHEKGEHKAKSSEAAKPAGAYMPATPAKK